jgi:hypothetical protein
MKELNNQNIDFNKFSNMNVIAQDKVAAALGLSSDELADQLLKQQYLGKSTEQVAALAGEEVAKRLEALNAQDKFNLAVEKMQDMLGKIAGGPLGKLVDMMATLAESTTMVSLALGAMAGLSLTKLIVGLTASAVQAGILAAGTVTATAALSAGLITAVVVGSIAAVMSQYASAKEEATKFADGGIVYGRTNAVVGEYQGAENNPEVIAPLSDLQSIIDKNRITVNNEGSQDTLNAIKALNDTMSSVKDGISKLNSKEGKVFMGSQQVGTAQLMANYNLA